MHRMATLYVNVSVTDDVIPDENKWASVNAGLRNAGMDIQKTHTEIGVLSGTIEDTQVAKAQDTVGVEAIEVVREVWLQEVWPE